MCGATLQAVVASFDTFPIGGGALDAVNTMRLHELGAVVFRYGLWIALPLIGMPWSHPFRLVQLAFVALGLAGAAFESERMHAGLAVVALALPAMAMLTVLSRPGSLAH